MSTKENIDILNQLRNYFQLIIQSIDNEELKSDSDENCSDMIRLAEQKNSWFTKGAISSAAKAWKEALNSEDIESWVQSIQKVENSKIVGVIMAGNIPFVGLHDAITVILSGHKLKAKLSSKDEVLMTWILNNLAKDFPFLKENILINQSLKDIEFLIATGTDNSARYFEAYFKDVPKIIRKNRTSISIIDGDETEQELRQLADDVFLYFGLGCRNVTKVYVPRSYDLDHLFKAFSQVTG